ncbi:CHAP domain-containing protein [Lactococcus garvieae]|uniref:Mannosyl-glycoprotein endo-beta-N-acetylglucosaminidase n=1 Tax=Lactococcus garvieae TaxID=1363 RepID=A0A1I4GGB3_9LACT|nr:CHAP domain-containing protein [Lactococcus garvieae]SFL29088.1 Mannosyl-glycoprotein endo-beta-N-acetylglucosaminidase [Lactococcus garvieae]
MGVNFKDKAKEQEKLVNKRSFVLGREKSIKALTEKGKRNRAAHRFKGKISKADSTKQGFVFRKTLAQQDSEPSKKGKGSKDQRKTKREKDLKADRPALSKRQQAAQSAKQALKRGATTSAFGAVTQDENLEDAQKVVNKVEQGKAFSQNAQKASRFLLNRTKKQEEFSNVTKKAIRFGGKAPKGIGITPFKPKKPKALKGIQGKIQQFFTKGAIKGVTTAASSNPVSLGIGAVVLLIIGLAAGLALLLGSTQSQASSTDGVFYVAHWDGKDAYHSSFLAQRYGITAKQIDGFIASEGFTGLDSRASGTEFLKLQEESGIDVRTLVAFAQMESSFGTAGVAKEYPKSNLFGYGAFDNDPDQGASWDNSRAVQDFRSTQIDGYGNKTLAICDERASQFHAGTLQPGQAVYWTAENSGKGRATIEEAFDKYIDEHGGTPKPPGGYGSAGGGGVGSATLSSLDKMLGQVIPGTYGGETGQCYAVPAYYAHSINSAITLTNGIAAASIGSDYDWKKWGWTVVANPKYSDLRSGDTICFNVGANMGSWYADPNYGHVGVVGKVLGNNQFLMYDQNPGPLKTWTVTYVSGGVASVIHPPSGK